MFSCVLSTIYFQQVENAVSAPIKFVSDNIDIEESCDEATAASKYNDDDTSTTNCQIARQQQSDQQNERKGSEILMLKVSSCCCAVDSTAMMIRCALQLDMRRST